MERHWFGFKHVATRGAYEMLKCHFPRGLDISVLAWKRGQVCVWGRGAEIRQSQLGLSQEWMWSLGKCVLSNDRRGLGSELWGLSPITGGSPGVCVTEDAVHTRLRRVDREERGFQVRVQATSGVRSYHD